MSTLPLAFALSPSREPNPDPPSLPPQWWRCVGVDMAVLETIGHELVDLYAQQPPGGKTAAVTPSSAVGAPIVLYRRQAT